MFITDKENQNITDFFKRNSFKEYVYILDIWIYYRIYREKIEFKWRYFSTSPGKFFWNLPTISLLSFNMKYRCVKLSFLVTLYRIYFCFWLILLEYDNILIGFYFYNELFLVFSIKCINRYRYFAESVFV